MEGCFISQLGLGRTSQSTVHVILKPETILFCWGFRNVINYKLMTYRDLFEAHTAVVLQVV